MNINPTNEAASQPFGSRNFPMKISIYFTKLVPLQLFIIALSLPFFNSAEAQYPPESSYERLEFTDPLKGSSAPKRLNPHKEIFSTTSQRVTDAASFSSAYGQNHSYSKRSAWNIDETYLVIGGSLVKADGYEVLEKLPSSSASVWSNTDPALYFGFIYQSAKFISYNIHTKQTSTVTELPGYSDCRIGHGEGNISNDDKHVVFSCTKNGAIELISYDLENQTILGTLQTHFAFNWAGFSQSGKYIIVENNNCCGTGFISFSEVYDKNFENKRVIDETALHGDFGIDENGEDNYISIGWNSISARRLRDLQNTILIGDASNWVGHGHLSCRNILRPGWCYFSKGATESTAAGATLGSVKVSHSNPGTIENFGFHRSIFNNSNYQAQPKASASPSGTKIIYTSNWFGTAEVSDYVVEVEGDGSETTTTTTTVTTTTIPVTTSTSTTTTTKVVVDLNAGFARQPVARVSSSVASIIFTLSQPSQTKVEFGTSKENTQINDGHLSARGSRHRKILKGLEQGTLYYYRIHSKGDSVSPWFTFTTRGIAKSSPKTGNAKSGKCVDPDGDGLGWNGAKVCTILKLTSEPAPQESATSARIDFPISDYSRAYIEYGESKSDTKIGPKETSLQYKDHSQLLTGLKSNTTYFYRIHFSGQAPSEENHVSEWFSLTTLKADSTKYQRIVNPLTDAVRRENLQRYEVKDSAFGNWGTPKPPSGNEEWLKVPVKKGTHWGNLWRNTMLPNDTEGWVSYQMRMVNWNSDEGMKLPGISGNITQSGWNAEVFPRVIGGNGGGGAGGTTGGPDNKGKSWSARMFIAGSDQAKYHGMLGFYIYHRDSKNSDNGRVFGEMGWWNQNGVDSKQILDEQWHQVKMYVKLNDIGKANGILRGYFDGKLAYERTNLSLVDNPKYRNIAMYLNVWHGGSPVAPDNYTFYMDDIRFNAGPIDYTEGTSTKTKPTPKPKTETETETPSTISDFKVTTNKSNLSASLSWNLLKGATRYSIYRDGKWHASSKSGTYTDNNISPNKEYSYKVLGVGSFTKGKYSNFSKEISVTLSSNERSSVKGTPIKDSDWSEVEAKEFLKFGDFSNDKNYAHSKPGDNQAMRAKFKTGIAGSTGALFKFPPKTQEAWVEYCIRPGDNFTPTNAAGSKLPGFAGFRSMATGGNGGRRSDGTNSWSARGNFSSYEKSEDGIPVGSYVYHTNQTGDYGNGYRWASPLGSKERVYLKRNEWSSVKQHIKMNSKGKNDGYLEAWVNGKKVLDKRGMNFTNNDKYREVHNFWLNVYYGGAGKPLTGHDIYFDQFNYSLGSKDLVSTDCR